MNNSQQRRKPADAAQRAGTGFNLLYGSVGGSQLTSIICSR